MTRTNENNAKDTRLFDVLESRTLMSAVGLADAVDGPLPFDANFTGGVYVAVAEVDNDGADDIVTDPGPGGGPHVKVFDGSTGPSTATDDVWIDGKIITAENNAAGFIGGVRVATGDVNGDGTPDIITAPGPGGGPHVKVFDGTSPSTTTPTGDALNDSPNEAGGTNGLLLPVNNGSGSDAAVPFHRVINNTVYGGDQPTDQGVSGIIGILVAR